MLHWNNWKTRTLHDLPGNQCNLDQCQFQATLPDEHGQDQYIKKPARLQCTDEGMAMELARLCPGDHYHLPIEGSSPGVLELAIEQKLQVSTTSKIKIV